MAGRVASTIGGREPFGPVPGKHACDERLEAVRRGGRSDRIATEPETPAIR